MNVLVKGKKLSFDNGTHWHDADLVSSIVRERLGCKSCNGTGCVHRTLDKRDLPCITCNTKKRMENKDKL